MTISKADSLRALSEPNKLSEKDQIKHLYNLHRQGLIAIADIPAILETMKNNKEKNNVQYN